MDVTEHGFNGCRYELQCLIDEVCGPIVKNTAALVLDTTPAARRSVTHNCHLIEVRRSEQIVVDNLFDGIVVPVPSAVMEDTEQDVVPLTCSNHSVRFGSIHRHDFVSDDMLACIHRLDGKFSVGVVRCG